MASTDYTDKQHETHLANYRANRTFPPNSVFDPHQGNGRLFRRATPEELARIGGEAPAPDDETEAED